MEPNTHADSKKHERFFLEDGNVTFLVDSILYRVHRYFFRHSNLLSRAHESVSSIRLTAVQSREFDAFLAIIYPSDYNTCELTTVDEWTSVLRLATKWGFDSIRSLAVTRLEPIVSAVDKVILAHAYVFLADWALPGYTELCHRAEPLGDEEGRRLGVDDVLLVCGMRERVRNSTLLFTKGQIALCIEAHLRPVPPASSLPPPPPPPFVSKAGGDPTVIKTPTPDARKETLVIPENVVHDVGDVGESAMTKNEAIGAETGAAGTATDTSKPAKGQDSWAHDNWVI
ncbi:hypothetical protein BV25DRAFT_1965296 [Artomyces pyxidatus]|uniref:Uncharacterized protein n=1 Tax=Artomyces pyxidatus TaxID=48021 RepID=A0ACB8SPL5_9AGAM|nr:hypothetical protein BV25DRAFT_1965296 [Artomyces pyxidatus]